MKPVMVIRHVPEESLGTLETVLRAGGLALQAVDCFADTWPAIERGGFHPALLAGLVVMGGPMNVDQTRQFPFLASEVTWLRQALQAGLPTLGICLGAQLLAAALGARVFPNPCKEIGWYEIELLPAAQSDPLLAGLSLAQTVFQWHGQTFDLPPGAVPLARGATCTHQAFRHEHSAWGFQFHPEMTAEMVVNWLAEPGMCAEVAALATIDPAEIRRQTPAALAAMTPLAEQVFDRFAELCSRHA